MKTSNQFIQFKEKVEVSEQAALPISTQGEIGFYFNVAKMYDQSRTTLSIGLATMDGCKIYSDCCSVYEIEEELQQLTATYYVSLNTDMVKEHIAINECFRLKAEWTTEEYDLNEIEGTDYSNPLQYVEDCPYYSTLKYFCKESEALGLLFAKYKKKIFKVNGYHSVVLPIHLSKPQFKQTDKIYETRNGEQIVLYATINKEYSGETDYIPEEWHERIVTALSCDEVYINGERVTKSDSYEIDQDNCTYSECGIRLTRATFKVKTNVTQRNSNC